MSTETQPLNTWTRISIPFCDPNTEATAVQYVRRRVQEMQENEQREQEITLLREELKKAHGEYFDLLSKFPEKPVVTPVCVAEPKRTSAWSIVWLIVIVLFFALKVWR
jgi:hypothetical protein